MKIKSRTKEILKQVYLVLVSLNFEEKHIQPKIIPKIKDKISPELSSID